MAGDKGWWPSCCRTLRLALRRTLATHPLPRQYIYDVCLAVQRCVPPPTPQAGLPYDLPVALPPCHAMPGAVHDTALTRCAPPPPGIYMMHPPLSCTCPLRHQAPPNPSRRANTQHSTHNTPPPVPHPPPAARRPQV